MNKSMNKFEDLESKKSRFDLESVSSDEDSNIEGDDDPSSSKDQAEKIKAQLAKRETAQVFRLRLLVFLVLAMAAADVSAVVYVITSSAEQDEYKTQYEGASKIVLSTFTDIVEAKLAVVSSLAVALIAHGADHQGSFWPFVTISSFQQRASTARAQSGSLYVQVNHMVDQSEREDWELYAVGADSNWIRQDVAYQREIELFQLANDTSVTIREGIEANEEISDDQPWPIWYRNENDEVTTDYGAGPYLVTWQTSPVFYDGRESNENILRSFRTSSKAANESYYNASVVLGEFLTAPPGSVSDTDPYTALYALLLSTFNQELMEYEGDPISQVFFPIFDGFTSDRKTVGVMTAWVHWMSYFKRILPSSLKGIMLVLNDSCGHVYTYKLDGENVAFLGEGDLHDGSYNKMKRTASFDEIKTIADGTKYGLPLNHDRCLLYAEVYPSDEFHGIFNTATPAVMTCAVAIIFIFTAFMFVFYDRLVERRQALVMKKAVETTAVVASLFPENVRERLIQGQAGTGSGKGGGFANQNNRLKGFINDGGKDDGENEPIAELYPRCTVLFSDLAGFTAWSSTREPAQVFILLQTVYQAFDAIAKRRKVFKVETIGDSYLAVTGLPEPMENHHSVMIRFAWDCMLKLNEITKELEITLGPDTGDLTMRFGVHSGPVTAGVLRGERARFQLFGDTVNTASRMESTGQRGKIQASHVTAALLQETGKGHWLRPRTDKIEAKGKGIMKTFWVNPTNKKSSTADSSMSATADTTEDEEGAQPEMLGDDVVKPLNQRLVAWMVDLLMDDIKKVVHSQKLLGIREQEGEKEQYIRTEGTTFLDEVQAKITMPAYDARVAEHMEGYTDIEIPQAVYNELYEYVNVIASMYRNNPFHNFEHACHVTMSVKKLLKRVVTPDLSAAKLEELTKGNKQLASHIHEYTHGLNSDPLVLLAITLSALIHDVDHRGVSNMQLAKEEPAMAAKFEMKSIAEQNSLDIAWSTLMEPRFEKLRKALFKSRTEMFRFCQLIINVVLATDIFDKELNDLRKARWTDAFCCKDTEAQNKDSDLRATIVIEHIIQASDVSHTMQHWHVYQKWNKALFKEMRKAYKAGRMAKDPAEFWYKGEIGFFDNYVIPLARKLEECGVFGVSSEEYLNYALQNRAEWEERGQELVKELVEGKA